MKDLNKQDNIKTILCVYYNGSDNNSCPYYKKKGFCNFAHGNDELKLKIKNRNKNNLSINANVANETMLKVTNIESNESITTPMTLIKEEIKEDKIIKTYSSPNSPSLSIIITENK